MLTIYRIVQQYVDVDMCVIPYAQGSDGRDFTEIIACVECRTTRGSKTYRCRRLTVALVQYSDCTGTDSTANMSLLLPSSSAGRILTTCNGVGLHFFNSLPCPFLVTHKA